MSSKRLRGRVSRIGFAFLLGAFVAAPATATMDTLKRSVENITQCPLDIVTSPFVAGQSIYRNMQDIDDSTGVRIAYPVPGYAWNLVVQWGASVLRGVTGVIEFLPGVVLSFTDADMEPLFDPAVENQALVDIESDIYHLKFGVDYTTPGF